MIPASTASSMSPAYLAYVGAELAMWITTSHMLRGFAFVRKEWQARRDEIVME